MSFVKDMSRETAGCFPIVLCVLTFFLGLTVIEVIGSYAKCEQKVTKAGER